MDKLKLKALLPKAFADLNALASSSLQSKVKGMYGKPKVKATIVKIGTKPGEEELDEMPHTDSEMMKAHPEVGEDFMNTESEEVEIPEESDGITQDDKELLKQLLAKMK